jgi:hypothetical protein
VRCNEARTSAAASLSMLMMRREWRSGRSVGTDARNGAGEWLMILYKADRRADYHQLSEDRRGTTAYGGSCVF